MNDLRESSALSRMQERYWATKQAVFKKLGKKDDECIIASDAELDAKLELFQTIEESFLTLMRVLENYQDKLCGFAQEENAMGRFLKENGKHDKTRAGKVMSSAGKALSYSAQQKLSLRVPLIRLYQEVETFHYRAIVDTLQTVDKMEKARTAYRGALMWMKDASQQLDPDTCKQLEKFRKVQSHVRKTKTRFDKLKLDTLQKIDLLSFSRCNLFSQALAAYQNGLINICKKISHMMSSVAETTKGYQHYEFLMLKELTETSKKLAEKTTSEEKPIPEDDKDALLFFESEYHDEIDNKSSDKYDDSPTKEALLPTNSTKRNQKAKKKKTNEATDENIDVPLLSLDNEEEDFEKYLHSLPLLTSSHTQRKISQEKCAEMSKILLPGKLDDGAYESDLALLKDILESSNDLPPNGSITSHLNASSNDQVNSITDEETCDSNKEIGPNPQQTYFLPSQLLDMNSSCSKFQPTSKESCSASNTEFSPNSSTDGNSLEKNKGKKDMSSWYNMFADLDPLSNPDLIGKKQQTDDRNC